MYALQAVGKLWRHGTGDLMIDYSCTKCGTRTGRELLTVKKVHFLEIGAGAKTVKTRTEAWLCPRCLVADPIYKLERWDAPGMKYEEEDHGSQGKSRPV